MLGSVQAEPITTQVIASLREGLGDSLVSVVLFGSRARDQARSDSDWDFLLIARGLPERTLDRHVFLKRRLPPICRGAVSFIAVTPEEFDTPHYLPSHYLDIALDGRILYDPERYAAARISALRSLISDLSLQRERTDAGVVWRSGNKRLSALALPWTAAVDATG